MSMDGETIVMIWLAVLVAPPMLFGIWMRVKLMASEEGHDFLVEREMSQWRAEHQTPVHMRDTHGEMRGKLARARVDIQALAGSHGEGVSEMLQRAVPFMAYYAVYAAIVGLGGYPFVF